MRGFKVIRAKKAIKVIKISSLNITMAATTAIII